MHMVSDYLGNSWQPNSKRKWHFACSVPLLTIIAVGCQCFCQPADSKGGFMGVIGWILFGLVVGVVGKLLIPGRDPGGFILTIVLGVAGALIGGFIGQALGFYQEGEPAGFIMAVLGSIILLLLYRMVAGRRTL
jgi:uncharacterized membrane protein YeaQ/YmgE (transglycosylase-associated protein family)